MTESNESPRVIEYQNPRNAKQKSWKQAAGITVGVLCAFALFVSLLLPSMGRARPPANRVKCSSNLKQIGLAMVLYANDNQGAFVPDFHTLLSTQDLVPEVFCCPQSDDERAPGTHPADWMKTLHLPGHISYVLVSQTQRLYALPANAVVAFEPIDNHVSGGYRGMNVLFADGHVEWADEADAKRIESQFRTGKRPVLYPLP